MFDCQDNDSKEEMEDSEEKVKHAGPSRLMREEFLQFANSGRFVAPLEATDHTGVRLMDILRRKKAPLNVYKALFEWHLRETGAVLPQEGQSQGSKQQGPVH